MIQNAMFINPPVFSAIMSGTPNRVRVAVKNTAAPCPYGKPGDQIWIHNERSAGFAMVSNVGIEPTHDKKAWMWAVDIEKEVLS